MPRFRVRTLMLAVGLVALALGSIEPGRRWYRRWTYHRSEAALCARLGGTERLNHTRERRAATDRRRIRAALMGTPGFRAKGAGEQERVIDNVVAFHRRQADQSLAAARRWAERRRDHETAAFWSWVPSMPDAP